MSNNENIIEEGMSQLEILEKVEKLRKTYGIKSEMLDAIGEMGNISMGSAATSLASILGKPVNITSPKVEVILKQAFIEYAKNNDVMLDVQYTKGIEANNYLLINKKTTKSISSIMTGGMFDGEEDINEMELSAVQEAMNQMMGRAATAMSDLFEKSVDISPPAIKQLNDDADLGLVADGFIRITFDLSIGDDIKSQIVQILECEQAVKIANEMMGIEAPVIEEKNFGGMLKQLEKDALGEIANISFGTASTMLSEVLNQKVSITAPVLEIVERKELKKIEGPSVILNVDYVEGINTENILIIKKQVAASIANLMMGGDGLVGENPEVGEMELSAVQEAMNQMMGNSATAMSELFERVVDISPPVVKLIEEPEKHIWDMHENQSPEDLFVKITFDLMIGELIQSKLVQAIPIEEGKKMATQLLEMTGSGEDSKKVNDETPVIAKELVVDENNVSPIIRKARVTIDVMFGNVTKTLEEILSMKEGDVVKLLEDVNAPLKIMANEVHVGYGNIVNVGENFAVEVVELVEK